MKNLWEGSKIRLKAIEDEKFLNYINSEDFKDSDYLRMVGSVEAPLSLTKLKEQVEKMIKISGENDIYQWMIEDLEGNVVGDINTYKCSPRNGTFMFGIAILKKYWNKGYASEAIKIMLQFYFHELRYQKVTSFIYSFNEASKKLHEKLGFKEEGRIRNMIYTNGEYYDHIYYGMTRDEFDEMF